MGPDFHFLHLPEVDSTNNYLKEISEQRQFDVPVLLVADNQTAGKGQGDNKWHSEPRKNLLLSLLIQEEIPVDNAFYLSKITALAIQKILEEEIGEPVRVKWTNDIYAGDKKIAGILIENVMRGDKITQSIIGVGLNLNQTDFPNELPNPVSLKQLTGKTYAIENFGIKFYNEFINLFSKFQQGFHNVLDNDYNHVLYKRNEWVKIRKNNFISTVKILSVDVRGYLIVENKAGKTERYAYGMVQFFQWVYL